MQIDINTLLSLNADNLAQMQHDALKAHVLSVLDNIQTLIEEEKYDEVINHVFETEDENGWNSPVFSIDFDHGNMCKDIIDVTRDLINLKELSNKKNKYI